MDVATLWVTVSRASPIEDNSTYKYHITCAHDGKTWEVTKRFSDFDALLQALDSNNYGGLPTMPSKTLLGSPTDDAVISLRKEQLRVVLHELIRRPDTRTSAQVRLFLDLDAHADQRIRSLLPAALRTFEDPRFGVSSFCMAPEKNLILVTHEDSTHLSRLGRVWSVVEADELGALHVWTEGTGGTWERVFSYTYGIKVRSVAWEDQSMQFFVGLEDGKIEIYEVNAQTLKPTRKAVLEMHHKSPVTSLCVTPKRLLSLGLDTAMRIIDVKTQDLVCGGRLVKRLKNEGDYLTCGQLDDASNRAFIGTSGGDIFILDVSGNPPNFLHMIMLHTPMVSKMLVMEDKLYVAHHNCVTPFPFEPKGNEHKMKRGSNYTSRTLPPGEVTILSLAIAEERRWIFGGFDNGCVAIWDMDEKEALVILAAHDCDVTQIVWLPSRPWGPGFYSGGGDGKVTGWKLGGKPEDYALWCPLGSSLSNDPKDPFRMPTADATLIGAPALGSGRAQADDDTAVFEPTFTARAAGSARQRQNPDTLRSSNDSDSDDLGTVFR